MPGTGDYGVRMNSIPKYVVSTTLQEAEWNNSRIITNNVSEELSILKQQTGLDILIFGSSTLVNSLMQYDLIDEYRLMVFPIVVGSGRRLFQDMNEKKSLKLLETKTSSSGVVVLSCQPDKNETK
jgi:dihydrofolate reductase